jgi:hypothetical protein
MLNKKKSYLSILYLPLFYVVVHSLNYPHLSLYDRWCVTKCIEIFVGNTEKSAIVFKLLSLKLILNISPNPVFFVSFADVSHIIVH